MRWVRVAVLLAVGVLVAQVANAKVPAFVRQTGLVCNQCHMTWTPNPDMTFTGTKFRLNGYRTPWVAEKIEAGEEGALNGRRLVLGIDGYLSYHMRSLLLTQAKPASDPGLSEPTAGAITTRPFQSLAWDFTGPIAENVGIWTEWYSTQQQNALGQPAVANQYGVVDNDEFDVKLVFNPGDGGNIVNFGINNQNLQNPFYGAFTNGAPRSGLGNTVNLSSTVWLRDRVAMSVAVVPGQNEQDVGGWDYKRMNYGFDVAVMPMNTDAMWLMFTGFVLAGNDQDPQSNIPGISALRAGPLAGQAYTSYDLGDSKRFAFDVRWGALDKGHWSWQSATGFNVSKETYSDGAEFKVASFGTAWRIFYDRTYGLLLGVNKYGTLSYTEGNGIAHSIPNDLNVSASLIFRQAMNFAWELDFNPTVQSLRLDQNWRNGYSWNLRWHFLY